jgi:DsbC/DsbD-like thiol-disulfide interchange protein
MRMSLALAMLFAASAAQAGPPARPELAFVADSVRAGEVVTAVVGIGLDRDWRIFWTNPGDSHVPTSVEWVAPSGWRVEALPMPVPSRFVQGRVVNFGYEKEVLLIARLHPPAGVVAGRYPVQAKVSLLACKGEDCIPTNPTLVGSVQVGSQTQTNALLGRRVAAQMARLPRPSPWPVQASVRAGEIALAISPGAAWTVRGAPTFLPFDPDLIDHAAAQTLRAGPDGVRVLTMRRSAGGASDSPDRIQGLLLAPAGEQWPGGSEAWIVDAPTDSETSNRASAFLLPIRHRVPTAYSVY